jgi:hypothetical protein
VGYFAEIDRTTAEVGLAPPEMKIAATADYVCLHCGRAYKRMGNPPRLTILSPVAVDDDDEGEEP